MATREWRESKLREDPDYVDRVMERWDRRRWKRQQWAKTRADFAVALDPLLSAIVRLLRRVGLA